MGPARVVYELVQAGLAGLGMYHATTWVGLRMLRRFNPPPPSRPAWKGELSLEPDGIRWVCVHGHVGVMLEGCVSAPHCGGTCVCDERIVALVSDTLPILSADHAPECPLYVEPIAEHHDLVSDE
jgi:hypothetical protein